MGEEKSRKTPFQKIISSRNEKERIYKSLLSCFFGKILGQAHSPPRRGGVAAPPKKMPRSHRSGADGVVRPAKRFGRTDHQFEASPYRARASRPARQLLLSRRATPPLRGGE